MDAAALKPIFIEQLSQVRSGIFLINIWRSRVTPELDSFVTNTGQVFQRAGNIASEFAAHRVKLKANGNRARSCGGERPGRLQGHTDATSDAGFDKVTACDLHNEQDVGRFTCIRLNNQYCVSASEY